MKKRHASPWIGGMFVALTILMLVLLGRQMFHHPHEVVLADPDEIQGGEEPGPSGEREIIRRVEVTPQTVQLAIERLARPENYSRTVTVERFWDGGGGKSESAVRAAFGWTRVDTVTGESQRHVITGDGKCWIWYGDEKVYSAAAALTADEEQSIPTYEDILRRTSSSITAADYREYETVYCIYVEMAPDEAGIVERDWVSVESGLLIATERVSGEELVYRMTALTAETDTVTAEAFTLPDGTVLFDPGTSGEAQQES